MSCVTTRPRLGELFAGALDGEDLEAVLAHVEGCDACGAELAELSVLDEELPAALGKEAQPASAPRVEAEPPTPAGLRWQLFVGPALAAAALLFVVTGLSRPTARVLRGGFDELPASAERLPAGFGPVAATQEDTRLALPDGSALSAGLGAELTLIDRRTVELSMGRAAFAIAKDETPFVLLTPQGRARVLGTTFQVEVREEQDMTNGAKISAAVTVVTLGVVTGAVLFTPDQGEPLRVDAGQAIVAGPGGAARVAAPSKAAEGEVAPTAEQTQASEQAKTLAAEKETLRHELEVAREEVAQLKQELATARRDSGAPAAEKRKQLPVGYGEWKENELLQNADWKEMAGAAGTMLDLMPELIEELNSTGDISPELGQKFARENTKMLRFAVETMGKLPSNVKATANGAYTHPIVTANLLTEHLSQVGQPLSEAQLWQLHGLGARYDDDWARVTAGYTEATPTLRKIQDELVLKLAFYDGMVALLTPPQQAIVVRPDLQHTASMDLYSPVLMLTRVADPESEPSLESHRQKLVELAQSWGFERADLDANGIVFDTWLSDLGELTPLTPIQARLWRLPDAMTALAAQLEAMAELESRIQPSDAVRKRLRDLATFTVPRLVAGE